LLLVYYFRYFKIQPAKVASRSDCVTREY